MLTVGDTDNSALWGEAQSILIRSPMGLNLIMLNSIRTVGRSRHLNVKCQVLGWKSRNISQVIDFVEVRAEIGRGTGLPSRT